MVDPRSLGAEIDALNLQTRRKISEIQRDLLPDLRKMVATQETSIATGTSAALPPKEQRLLFSLKTAMAIADLSDLREALSQYLELVSDELRRRNLALIALAAYGQSRQNRFRKPAR